MRVVDYATMKGDGKTNQDRYLIGDYYAAVLDGASAYPPQPQGRDGGWYADQLAREIERLISPSVSLENMLADAIQAVASAHNLVPRDSPSSTIALARWNETDIECLVLGDSSVVVSRVGGGIEHLIDDRLANVAMVERQAYRRRLAAGHGYDDRHRVLLAAMQNEQHRRRNVRGGYWIAGAQPAAATQTLRRRYPLAAVRSILIMSDGVVAGFWHPRGTSAIVEAVESAGCQTFVRLVHEAEAEDGSGVQHPRSKRHDDKTMLLIKRD